MTYGENSNPEDTSALTLTKSSETHHCLICFDPLTYRTILPCNHNDVCPVCALRSRHLHGDLKCPICKKENEQVIVDSIQQQKESFDDYPIWGNDLGNDFLFKEEYGGMFVRVDYYQRVLQPLLGYQCVKCNDFDGTQEEQCTPVAEQSNRNQRQQHKSPLRLLQDHLRTAHRLTLCNLCVDNRRDFVSRLPRFTPSQLQKHLKQGDGPNSAFRGHPVCEFCRPKRFYDLQQLHEHLRHEHYKCDMCEKQGKPNQFFKNYNSLQRHFDQQHFLCHNPACLEARFVVFESELDLRHHERQVHGVVSSESTKINLQFRYNRPVQQDSYERQEVPSNRDFDYDLEGQAFVPEEFVAPPTNGSDTPTGNLAHQQQQSSQLHPLHLQRTAQLRERAAQLAQEQGLASATPAFPSLSSSSPEDASNQNTSSQQQLRAGWTGGRTIQRVGIANRNPVVGANRDEAFPALPTSNNNNKKKTKKAANQPLSSGAGSRNPTATASSNTSTLVAIQRAETAAPPPWGSGPASSSSVVARTATPTVATMRTITPPGTKVSTTSPNLSSADQFPSLGGGTSNKSKNTNIRAQSNPYASANALARQLHQSKQPTTNSWNTSAPSSSVRAMSSKNSKTNGVVATKPKQPPQPQRQAPQAPQLNSMSHFPPPPPTEASLTKASIRDQLRNPSTGGSKPTYHQTANVLQVPLSAATRSASSSSSASAKSAIEDLKATLGKQKYKELKRLTGEFAGGSLDGTAYIDLAAALFDKGYGDDEFWNGVPSLVESCPAPPTQKTRALQYLSELKRLRHGAMNAQALTTAAATASSTSSARSSRQTPKPATATVPTGAWSKNKPKTRR